MGTKLNSGERFPELTLNTVDGRTLVLPGGVDGRYRIVLFYRGHW